LSQRSRLVLRAGFAGRKDQTAGETARLETALAEVLHTLGRRAAFLGGAAVLLPVLAAAAGAARPPNTPSATSPSKPKPASSAKSPPGTPAAPSPALRKRPKPDK
jgi:hypothetical protein